MCTTSGVRKFSTKCFQSAGIFLNTNEHVLPTPVENGKSLKYIGRYFDFEISNQTNQLELKETLADFLQRIEKLNIHHGSKLYVLLVRVS